MVPNEDHFVILIHEVNNKGKVYLTDKNYEMIFAILSFYFLITFIIIVFKLLQ